MPFRIDLAGGWLDQPFVSKFHPGAVITASIEPTMEFSDRSGMASSTRKRAIELWGNQLPSDNPQRLGKVLFCYDNPPGTIEVSGSQDALGIVLPGVNKLNYNGNYWPQSIETTCDQSICEFLEKSINLIPLGPRKIPYNVLANTNITTVAVKELSDAAESCWEAIMNKDLTSFGKSLTDSFNAQVKMFPAMVNEEIINIIDAHRMKAAGWKITGAGGGGYLIIISDNTLNYQKICVRRR